MKEKIKKIFGESKEIIEEYKFTFILILITTLLALFLYDDSDYNELLTTLMLSGVLFFMVETFTKKNKVKIPLLIGSVGISALFNNILYDTTSTTRIPLLILGLYATSFLVSIYKISKKTKDFHEYFLKIVNNNIALGIALSILQLGLLFITFTISELLIPNSSEDLFTKMEIIFLGLFSVPGELLCLTNTKVEAPKALKFLICYILLPIVLISMLIIYIYFAKMIITHSIPSNQIFAIITILFVIAIPTYILIMNYDDNKFIKRILNQLPWTFLPLIAMAMYSLGVRIYNYGITISRYFGIMVIALELGFFVLSLKKNHKHMRSFILYGTGIVLVSMVLPFINCVGVARTSQLRRLMSVYKEDTNYDALSTKEKNLIYDSYRYIKYDLDSEKYIPKYIDETKLTYNNTSRVGRYISYYDHEDNISVKGFSYMKEINIDEYDVNINNMELNDIELYKDKEQNDILKIALKNELSVIIEDGDVTNPQIKLDAQYEIYIKSLSMSYNDETNEISYLNISAYLLTK